MQPFSFTFSPNTDLIYLFVYPIHMVVFQIQPIVYLLRDEGTVQLKYIHLVKEWIKFGLLFNLFFVVFMFWFPTFLFGFIALAVTVTREFGWREQT